MSPNQWFECVAVKFQLYYLLGPIHQLPFFYATNLQIGSWHARKKKGTYTENWFTLQFCLLDLWLKHGKKLGLLRRKSTQFVALLTKAQIIYEVILGKVFVGFEFFQRLFTLTFACQKVLDWPSESAELHIRKCRIISQKMRVCL